MLNDFRLAVYNACVGLGVPVYDYWVTDGQFPYVIVGELTTSDKQYKLNEEVQVSIQVHIFEKSKGKTRVNGYVEQLRTAFKEVEGINKRFNSRIIEDVQPNVNHGIVTLSLKQVQNK